LYWRSAAVRPTLKTEPDRRGLELLRARCAVTGLETAISFDPSTLSYREWHLIADRLIGDRVCRLEVCPGRKEESASGGTVRCDLELRFQSSPAPEGPSQPPPMLVEAPTLAALLEAIFINEQEVVTALHEAGLKRFFADYRGELLQSNQRVVLLDLKFEIVMEYADPFAALEVYERLSAARVVPRNKLAILEWTPERWVKVAPDSIELSGPAGR
jgi:hypothetical protein